MAIGYLDDSKLTAIADAIRTKAGTSGSMTVDQMPANIAAIPSGGGAVIEKDVNFYDWDGTLLYSYTLAEAQALSALPPLPGNYKDYTADSWTETLSFVKSLTRPWMVGVNYTTQREGAYIYITVPEPNTTLGEDLSIYFRSGPSSQSSTVWNIDWGDGTSQSITTLNTRVSHTYSQAGDYKLTVDGGTGGIVYLGASNIYTPMLMSSQAYVKDYSGRNQIITDKLVTAVEPGHLTRIDSYAFAGQIAFTNLILPKNMYFANTGGAPLRGCGIKFLSFPSEFTNSMYSLTQYLSAIETIIAPSSIRGANYSYDYNLKQINWPPINPTTSSGLFRDCVALDQVIDLPEGITSISSNAFNMDGISPSGPTVGPKIGPFPSTLTSIGSYAFNYYCGPINTFRIPASVTSIGDYAFYTMDYCYITTFIFESSTPPTIYQRTFGPPSMVHIKIYVPYGTKATYVASSTEWSSYANFIYELPQA